MDHATHNKIVSFIWSIADDCLRDVFALFTEDVKAALKKLKLKPGAPQLKQILDAVSWRDPEAAPIVAKEFYQEIDNEEQILNFSN